jgi:alginate O-acetyltransferase complex protein AlgI
VLFNSIEYAFFLPIVFILYWFVSGGNLRAQNAILIAVSYLFYGWWDYRFLFLLIFSTFLDYYTGLKIFDAKSLRNKKIWLILSIGINLGFLGFFKYYNFFIDSFADLLEKMGFQVNIWTLNVILPVGISFYTFHGLSYVLDIYYGKFRPTRNFIDYGLFVSFFPLLVAGPIERATHLLPQVQNPRKFDYAMAVDGLRQILWGLFKKVVIADNCAGVANTYFSHYWDYGGIELFLGAVFFAFQIYGDFSGYSDIALGTSKLFGINLLKNFAFPYFSRDIAEFWRRWHISLSSWFRDYLYIPLGGSKVSVVKRIRNTFIIFIVSGFWHGANWTFVAWGVLNAFYFLPLLLTNNNRNHIEIVAKGKLFPSFGDALRIAFTFSLVVIAWIFFRAKSIAHALLYIKKMMLSIFMVPHLSTKGYFCLALITGFIAMEWLGRSNEYAIQKTLLSSNWLVRWTFYYILIVAIMVLAGKQQQFIYFQF